MTPSTVPAPTSVVVTIVIVVTGLVVAGTVDRGTIVAGPVGLGAFTVAVVDGATTVAPESADVDVWLLAIVVEIGFVAVFAPHATIAVQKTAEPTSRNIRTRINAPTVSTRYCLTAGSKPEP